MIEKGADHLLGLGMIAWRQPMDIGISAKPGHLALGVTPVIPFKKAHRFFPIHAALDEIDHMAVAQGLH
jgi:hypothetical protein